MNIEHNYLAFADENYLLHHRPNPTTNTSENELLFTAEYAILQGKAWNPRRYIANQMLRFYKEEVAKGHKISHDNKTGMVALYPNLKESIFRVGGRVWLHPRDIIYYGYMKYGAVFYPLLPIVSMANIISCYRTYKTTGTNKHITTSGKLLAMVRNLSAGLRLTQWICTKLIHRNENFKSWENVARIYFPDVDGMEHPVVQNIKVLDK